MAMFGLYKDMENIENPRKAFGFSSSPAALTQGNAALHQYRGLYQGRVDDEVHRIDIVK